MKPRNSLSALSVGTVAFGMLFALTIPVYGQGMPDDWTHHHVVFSNPGSFQEAMKNGSFDDWYKVAGDPRFVLQQRKRKAASQGLRAADMARAEEVAGISSAQQASARKQKKPTLKRDWNLTLGAGGVAATMYPAKFTFSVTGTPSCSDFAVFGVNTAGVSGSQANIVGITNLYSGSSPTGLCGSAPTVRFSYFVGTGTVQTSPVLSLDGTKVAFIESITNGSRLHVLKIGTTGGNGTSATSPVVPGTGNNATDTVVTLSGGRSDTRSSVYPDYNTDNAYVGDNSGLLHKFTGVFNGTPAEAGSPWPATVAAGITLTGPTFDPVSQKLFVGGSNGTLYAVAASAPGTVQSLSVGNGGTFGGIVDPPIVDSTIYPGATLGHVFAEAGDDGTLNCGVFQTCIVLKQADTALGNAVTANMGTGGVNNAHAGAFDNLYFGSVATGHMYFCGNRNTVFNSAIPRLWRVGFSANGTMNGANDGNVLTVASASGVECSPLTEINNGSTDWLFLGVTASGSPAGCSGGGCVMNFNITSAFPGAATAAAPESGGTSGIIIDNVSGSAQASSIYFGTLASPRNAVKLTQAGLL